MRSALGFLVLAVGLVFGAVAYFPHLGVPTFSTPWAMLSPAEAALADPSSGSSSRYERVAQFSEGAALLVAESGQVQSDAPPLLPASPAAQDDSKADVALQPWRSAVLTDPSGFGTDGNQVRADRLDASERLKVASDIQTELQRVGCYAGEIDGVWGGASRRALATFLDRVNATLPTDQPDVILLTLIRAQPAGTCGVDCPAGQELNGANQCVPSAILAQATKHRSVKPAALVASHAPVSLPPVPTSSAPLPGRMSVGATSEPRPRLSSSFVQTAELEPDDGAPAAARSAVTSFEDSSAQRSTAQMSPPREKRAATVSRSQKVSSASSSRGSRGNSGYRSVQRLFENPLGRL